MAFNVQSVCLCEEKKMVMTWRGSGGTVEGGYCVFVTICEVWKYILTGR